MGILGNFFKNTNVVDKGNVDESIKAFEQKPMPKIKDVMAKRGEGWENIVDLDGVGNVGLSSFNTFYRSYIDKHFENEVQRINEYRIMASMTEIADVIEDATNESTQVDEFDELIHLNIKDDELSNNTNIVSNITKEFNDLFKEKIDIEDILWDMVYSYYVDGRMFYERIIDTRHKKQGIINIKKLPSETMDYIYDPMTGKIQAFFQYLTGKRAVRPTTVEELEKRDDVILFHPKQIGFVNNGVYGQSKYEILGYLEKAKIPYNQLKLLETSVIIYRIIRAPERIVFRIDTGNMPRDKALKYVEKIKQKMTKKQSYNPTTGKLSQDPEILCIRNNTEIPLLDGRYLTLNEIIKEHEDGKENWVYSINEETKNIEPGKIVNAKITRKNEKLIRVWMDDNYIDVTYDHKFILRDGSTCRADNLVLNQSLMPLYKKNERIRSNVKNEYEMVYNPSTNKWCWTHNLVSTFFNGKKEKYFVDHHKNFNAFDNTPNNLLRMHRNQHSNMHSECVKKAWRENYDFMYDAICRGRETLKNDKVAMDKMKKTLKQLWVDDYDRKLKLIQDGLKKWYLIPENKKRQSEWVTKTNIDQNKAKKMIEVLNTPEVREKQRQAAKEYQLKKWSNPLERQKMSKMKTLIIDDFLINKFCEIFNYNNKPKRDDFLNILTNNKIFIDYFNKINYGKGCKKVVNFTRRLLKRFLDILEFSNYTEFKENFNYNHKITKIEYLNELDDTGCITVDNNHNFAVSQNSKTLVFIRNSLLENYYVPQSADGRGSQIDTIGGNSAGFSELDDVYYFARKLYRALKYPISRVTAGQENRDADIMFGGGSTGEISRDEIKWSKFLERNQKKFCNELTKLFLLHLEFKGLKEQYGLDNKKISVTMNPPSKYKEQMEANFVESRHSNYQSLADREEMSKYFLMKRYLKWTDEDIQENVNGRKKDKEFGFTEEDI